MTIIPIDSGNLVKADHHFNAAVFKTDKGLHMAYRINRGFDEVQIFVTKLDEKTFEPSYNNVHVGIKPPRDVPDVSHRFEDPRMIWCNERLYCAFTYMRADRLAQCQGIVEVSYDTFQPVSDPVYLPVGHNHNQALRDPQVIGTPEGAVITRDPGTRFEKNWQFFKYRDALAFVYCIAPQHVVCTCYAEELAPKTSYNSPGFSWDYGEPRGGTPPVRIGHEYFTFFHSHLEEPSGERVYHVGAYSFDASPPFKITGYTKKPLLSADRTRRKALWKNSVVFPCGALFDSKTKEWLISYGVNDDVIELAKLPHQSVLVNLTKP